MPAGTLPFLAQRRRRRGLGRRKEKKTEKKPKVWRSGAGRGVSDLFPEYMNFNFSIFQFFQPSIPQPPIFNLFSTNSTNTSTCF